MTKTGPRKTVRLFVAVYPPATVAPRLLARLPEDLPPHRTTTPEQVHLTMQFIGDMPPKKVDEIIESVERSVSGLRAVSLVPLRLITLPRRGPKRLVAVETDAPGSLMELKRRLVTRLAHDPRRDSADRFLPHLTVCRFRAPARMDALDDPLDEPAFPVEEVRLMRSVLLPTGAEHREVASFALM
ncbi:MAG: RNA 2',3'-cyclic phosphodiesterase [Planctomycetes bacterium]|nr:RNA 2',3'-cyclic phosphodiesterase [Planctomycetota bacterium]